mgnify:CR=1 FL=1
MNQMSLGLFAEMISILEATCIRSNTYYSKSTVLKAQRLDGMIHCILTFFGTYMIFMTFSDGMF